MVTWRRAQTMLQGRPTENPNPSWNAEGLRVLAKKAQGGHLYALADGEAIPEDGEPEVVFCMDEFGPLNLQPSAPSRSAVDKRTRNRSKFLRGRGLPIVQNPAAPAATSHQENR